MPCNNYSFSLPIFYTLKSMGKNSNIFCLLVVGISTMPLICMNKFTKAINYSAKYAFQHTQFAQQNVAQKLQNNSLAKARVRKAFFVRCGVSIAMLATACSCGYVFFKRFAHAKPALTLPMLHTRVVAAQQPFQMPEQQPTVRAPAQDYSQIWPFVGFLSSACALAKGCAESWRHYLDWGSLKKDTNALLTMQEEALKHHEQQAIAQKVTQELLQERDKLDALRWQEQEAAVKQLQTQQAELCDNQNIAREILDRVDTGQQQLKNELEKILAESTQLQQKIDVHHQELLDKLGTSETLHAVTIAEIKEAVQKQSASVSKIITLFTQLTAISV